MASAVDQYKIDHTAQPRSQSDLRPHECNLNKFFQAEDGIRDVERSRGLGDVYKRQVLGGVDFFVLSMSLHFQIHS